MVLPSPVVLKKINASYSSRVPTLNLDESSVASKIASIEGPLLFKAPMAAGMDSCLNPRVAE